MRDSLQMPFTGLARTCYTFLVRQSGALVVRLNWTGHIDPGRRRCGFPKTDKSCPLQAPENGDTTHFELKRECCIGSRIDTHSAPFFPVHVMSATLPYFRRTSAWYRGAVIERNVRLTVEALRFILTFRCANTRT